MITDNDIIVELAHDELLYAAKAVRRQVFVKEQGIPENDDLDTNENYSIHVIAYVRKRHRILPVGTMRIRSFAGFVKFERMAVTRNFRKTKVSDAIMQYAFDFVAQKGYRQVSALCKEELLPRWQRSGFYENKEVERVEQNGMVLIPIIRDLPPHPHALTINSSPSLLIAEEGHWSDVSKEEKRLSKFEHILTRLEILKEMYLSR